MREITASDRAYILDHYLVGLSASEIASILGLTRSQVIGQAYRHSPLSKGAPAAPPSSEAFPVPPAMAALAAFDPVIARACEMRRAGMGLRPAQ